jgi:dihydroneopterin aldolase
MPQVGDELLVDGITFRAVIGVTERERRAPQPLVVNVRLTLDFGRVRTSDAIRDTVDYRAIVNRIVALGEASRFRLVGRLAGYLGEQLLAEFPRLVTARVEVEKPGILERARSVRVALTSCRASGGAGRRGRSGGGPRPARRRRPAS